jgi:hypothetical protein
MRRLVEDHQRSSVGHGPADQVTSCQGAPLTWRRAGVAVSSPRPLTPTGRAAESTNVAGDG